MENDELTIERENIDKIDLEIINLLDKRIKIVKRILEIKIRLNLPIFNPIREKEKLARIREISVNSDFNEEIFKIIIQKSRELQEDLLK